MRALALLVAGLAGPALAQSQIAPTDAKTPADERKSFTVPAGFEVQLVAADPDIGKPIQIAFDARGRLWVTTSRHYPFPAAAGEKPADRLFVLSDFGDDGKARKVETFADDLNIPIGILPLPDCKSCLVSHVGSILKLTDTNGDGKADRRETILTGFGTRDTHGMMNSFVLLPDGWVYACHGYLNESTVKAKDGSQVKMQSGNTFRFRPDGSRVEPWTFGQVNPFGLTVDPYLNLYTADCHSKPITQLIRGAYYDSFGKPHDGLGYAPHVTRHDHGSTALCGLAWYQADHFPKEWSGCMFLGNVITNRVNADRIEWKGATPVAKELPDFLTSSDPWFRPTDIKLGPDGALYVADFYNRIIGHYEVDLKHPQRDKDRGRVWRVVWKGTDGKAKPPRMPFADLTKETPAELVGRLEDANLVVRLEAANQLARHGKAGLDAFPQGNYPKLDWAREHPRVYAPYLMLAAQAGVADDNLAGNFASLPITLGRGPVPDELTAGIGRGVGAVREWGLAGRQIAAAAIRTDIRLTASPQARRAFVEAIAAHPHPDFVEPLVALLKKLPADDTHLRHAARVALRNALRDADGWAKVDPADGAVIADVALGVPSQKATGFLLARLRTGPPDPRACEHIGRHGSDGQAAAAVEALRKPATAAALLALVRGLQARGAGLPADSKPVVEQVCSAGLDNPDPAVVQSVTDVAAALKLAPLFDPLAAFAVRADRSDAQRGAAMSALLAIDATKGTPLLAKALNDAAAPMPVRQQAAQALGGSGQQAARDALVAAMATAPARLASSVALGLAGSPAGADALLDAVKAGKASAQLLQEKAVAGRLLAIDRGRLKPRLDDLTKGLPSADAKLAALIRTRSAAFPKASPDAAKGKDVFTKQCAICHQLGGQGAKVGPQLDGVGGRGLDRLLEDVLDPNRNVDAAFRATTLNLLDGRTVTGLVVREEGQVTVIVDANGKEVRVEAKDIDKKATGVLSAMPANVEALIPEADFHHLLAYLLEQKPK